MFGEISKYVPQILSGLWITIWVSLLSIVIALIPGWLLVIGKASKNTLCRILSSIYILIFDGIPFLVQLILVFYIIPQPFQLRSSEIFTALLLLSLNATADIAKYAMVYLKNRDNINLINSIKITLLAFATEFGEVIKLTTLVSLIGLPELYQAAKHITSATADTSLIYVIAIIYLVISIITKAITYFLGRILFPQRKD